MAIWYTADTHFGHENILHMCNRPFETISQMDTALLENMWKVVGSEDQLWILGDLPLVEKRKTVPTLRASLVSYRVPSTIS